jgi:hypothetical protein
MSTTKKNDAKAADPSPDDRLAEPYNEATQESIEEYDELVLCVLADTAKRLLGDTATWMERKVLGSAKFSDDITVTHCDTDCGFYSLCERQADHPQTCKSAS